MHRNFQRVFARLLAFVLLAFAIAMPAQARWQCVTYARSVTAFEIHGNAHTWWAQAEGEYARGATPEIGSVMVLRPHGNMRLGHVAKVSRIVNEREVLLDHANWSRPGMVEHDVLARDVSANNDWSEVRIWYSPSGQLGTSVYPVYGFIYPEAPADLPRLQMASDEAPANQALLARYGNAAGGGSATIAASR